MIHEQNEYFNNKFNIKNKIKPRNVRLKNITNWKLLEGFNTDLIKQKKESANSKTGHLKLVRRAKIKKEGKEWRKLKGFMEYQQMVEYTH